MFIGLTSVILIVDSSYKRALSLWYLEQFENLKKKNNFIMFFSCFICMYYIENFICYKFHLVQYFGNFLQELTQKIIKKT